MKKRRYLTASVLLFLLMVSVIRAEDAAFTACKRGYQLFADEQYDEAFQAFDEAVAADPGNAYAYGLRGTAYYWRFTVSGQKPEESPLLQKALADLTKAVQLDPHLAMVRFSRAVVCEMLRDYDGAIEDATKAIELYADIKTDPYIDLVYSQDGFDAKRDLAQLYYIRGYSKWRKHQMKASIEDIDKAAELCPENELYVIEREKHHTLQGEIDELRERNLRPLKKPFFNGLNPEERR